MKKTLAAVITFGIRLASRIPIIGSSIIKASYDAVQQTWGERSWLYQALQDAWIEIDAQTRSELQRIHAPLIENSSIVQKIRNLFLQFSVGPSGLIVTPNASLMDGPVNSAEEKKGVEQWNQVRAVSWEGWWRRPELNCNISGSQLTRTWSGLLFDTGEIFVVKTNETLPNGKVVPRIQTIDSFRCATPDDSKDRRNIGQIIDGIEVDEDGKRLAYWFKRAVYKPRNAQYNDAAGYDRIPAERVIHKFKVRRPGQMRGIPEGFSCYNLIRDNMDLHKMEMQAAKLASSIANVETNPSGELSAYANRQTRLGISGVSPNGSTTTRNNQINYKVTLGSSTIALQNGDSLKQFMIDRPTVATQNYWDLHYTMICLGYNIPKLLVMPHSLQGTVTRADLDVASYGFGREQYEIVAELVREIYEWQTEWAVKFDRSMDGPKPQDYLACHIRPPRAPNVDVGYNASAEDTQLRNGTKTVQDVFAEKQQDWRAQVTQQAEYLKFVKETAKNYGVEPSQITDLMVTEATKQPEQKEEKEDEEKDAIEV